ncbi:MAG: nitrous oxide reductase accessory protein NosL [Maritimibacter sp.]|nr:nitrous oxide reductase accessory protein NosL [Maritimibacter sp.]
MNRRDFILSTSTGAFAAVTGATVAHAEGMAPMQSPMAWTDEHGLTRFLQVDTAPLENEFEKYPRCPYCGMMRERFSFSRHLIVYDNDTVDATCSIHCASISLALNMDAGPKTIYAGDAGADGDIKPLVEVEQLTYVFNPDKPGTMTMHSKFAFADPAKAEAAVAESPNARAMTFDEALRVAYAEMADNTIMLRKRRGEKRSSSN